MRQWVKVAGLPPEAEAQVGNFLEKLGAMDLDDLRDLEEGDVASLMDIIPKLKKNKFKERLAVHRPVPHILLFLSLLSMKLFFVIVALSLCNSFFFENSLSDHIS